MRVPAGTVFSLEAEHAPIPGCTVSQTLSETEDASVTVFSLAEQTDISAELFPHHKLLVMVAGEMEVSGAKDGAKLADGDCLLTPRDVPVGMRTGTGSIYIETTIRRSEDMNQAVSAGEVFRLAELIPYQEGKVVNMDVLSSEHMKFVVMSFGAGTGLSEHAAPGEALIFALDGEATIVYEGAEHTIRAGENFHFAKGGLHAIRADERFKMALLLTLA